MTQKLRPRYRKFVAGYLKTMNETKAALYAGYSPKSAPRQGSRVYQIAQVRAAIDDELRKLEEKNAVTKERVLEELGRIAFADIRQAFTEDGKLKPIHEIPDELAHALSGIDIE